MVHGRTCRSLAWAATLAILSCCTSPVAGQQFGQYLAAPSHLHFSGTEVVPASAYDYLLNDPLPSDPISELRMTVEDQAARLAKLEEASKPKSSPITHKWSGRIHFDYWGIPGSSPLTNFLDTGDPTVSPEDMIGFRRLRLGMKGAIYETMLYKVELDFAEAEDPRYKDTYLGWHSLPFLQTVLLGNQKRPYGLDHLNSSRFTTFMERPFHVEAFNQDARRFGIASYGHSDRERWSWRFGYFLMDDLSEAGHQRTDNYQSEVAARLANNIWYDEVSGGRGYAHWAVSGSLAYPGGGPDGRFRTRPETRTDGRWLDTGESDDWNRYQLLGLEAVVNVGPVHIVGEYQTVNVDRFTGPNLDFGGGYVYVAYFLTGEHVPWERDRGTMGRVKPFENFFLVDRCFGGCGHGWGAWQIAARYSHADFSDEDILGGVGDSFTFGLNWWWTPNSRMQFNYIHGYISQRDTATTGGDPLPPGVASSGDYDVFATRFMVDF